MVVYLWKYLWKKTQTSLRYVKIALCVFVAYLLILSIFARVFQTNKANLYTKKVPVKKADAIREFITNKKLNSTKSGKLVISIYKGLTCSLIGEACYKNLDKKNPSNASMAIASVFAYPFLNPPASGVGATVHTLAQAGFIPKSYAAEGVGFASIRPLMGVWKAMRDVAYLVLVLVIVTIGFMIMLRTKINPQTIVNVENSLPKIVMSLIYITFSFAIVGFLIDLMYVSLILIIAILGPQFILITPATGVYPLLLGPKNPADLIRLFLRASPFDIVGLLFNFDFMNIFWTLPTAILMILGDGISTILRLIVTVVGAFFLKDVINKALEFATKPDVTVSAIVGLQGIVGALLSALMTPLGLSISFILAFILVPFILGIIIFLTVLMLFFRIIFLLFSNYVKLLLLIVISPLFLLAEAIPGQSAFSTWIKNVLELLVPFPVIVATFLIGAIIMGKTTNGAGTLFTPPFLVGINPGSISPIIGLWIVFMIPEFIALAQKAINPKPLPLEGGIGTFFGGAKTGVETGMSELSKVALIAPRIAPLNRLLNAVGLGQKGQQP